LSPGLNGTLGDEAPGAQVLVRGLVQGPPVAAPVELRVVGPDLDTLRAIGDDLMTRLGSVGKHCSGADDIDGRRSEGGGRRR
jgi:multidrug efflux pump subunit AcrB